MTITILKLNTKVGKMPRPHNRASSLSEMSELLMSYCVANGWSFELCASGRQYFPENLDTDEPVLHIRGTTVKFYAYTER